MKLGIITPGAFVSEFAAQSTFHLVLTHVCIDDTSYRTQYQVLRKGRHFIMLDHSIQELGTNMTWTTVLGCAIYLGANEILLPEVLRNRSGTITAIDHQITNYVTKNRTNFENALKGFLVNIKNSDRYSSEKHDDDFVKEQVDKWLNQPKTFAVTVQGDTFKEMRDCYIELKNKSKKWNENLKLNEISNTSISTICIPFDIDCEVPGAVKSLSKSMQRVYNRIQFIDSLIFMEEASWDHQHHLLGLQDGVELQHYAVKAMEKPDSWYNKQLRSCDSSTCFQHGIFGHLYNMKGLPVEKVPYSPMNFSASWHGYTPEQLSGVQHNIDVLQTFIRQHG